MTGTCAPAAKAAVSKDRFKIRPVVAQDLPALTAMVAALATQSNLPATATPEALGRDLLAPGVNAWLTTIVAERTEDGIPVGYAIICRNYDAYCAEKTAFLSHIFVAPEARGYGLGAALLRSAREQASEWGCVALRGIAGYENLNARHFYKSQGVTERARSRWYYILRRLARTLGLIRHLHVEFSITPLSGRPSPADGSGDRTDSEPNRA